MKVLVLGGAGAVAEHSTRDLAEFSDFDEIVIGDFNVEAAKQLAADIGDARLKVVQVDANDYDQLVGLIEGFDVVLNGLPWKYDLAVTKACVEAGVSGLDVSTEESQWDYHEEAKAKDIIFIPGLGATPGITNAMARRGADLMDDVDEIQINFAAFRCAAPSMGLLITLLWEFDPTIESRLYYRDDKFTAVGPFAGAKIVDFPGPIGEQEVYYIPHPETRTLPKSLGAKAVSVHGCFPPHVMQMVKSLLKAGFYGRETIRVKGIEITPFDLMHKVLIQLPESKENPLWAYGLVVEIFGTKQGHQIKAKLWNRHPGQEEWGGKAAYYKNIALPLSIAVQMIARGDVTARGVLPPESTIDPLILFRELQRRGLEIHEQVEEYHVLA
jgi:saccharopine dehydrogenase-like NADP-dependent oxidoreductase